jgi:predicted DNA-binding transcriptional regulator YafY
MQNAECRMKVRHAHEKIQKSEIRNQNWNRSSRRSNTPLTIRYYTAGRDATTDRVVDPLRVEWRGPAGTPAAVPYLVGWCHLRQDERLFRVDRILEILP